MLAIAFTLLLGAYLFGPGLVARLILGFVVPRKTLIQSRSEEITRSVLQAVVPLCLGWMWASWSGALRRCGGSADFQHVFSGAYSVSFFDAHRAEFFRSLHAVYWMNLCVLWRLYLLVVLFALTLNWTIRHYRGLRGHMRLGWQKGVLATVVLPRISEWHVLLSGMLLPSDDLLLEADVLTKSNTLYQGQVQDKMLGGDGSLQSIMLAAPRRFLRDEYRKALEADANVSREAYWRPISGNLFVILGSGVVNLILRYIRKQTPTSGQFSNEERQLLRNLLNRL